MAEKKTPGPITSMIDSHNAIHMYGVGTLHVIHNTAEERELRQQYYAKRAHNTISDI